jgi:hypothetical protein
MKRLKRLRPEDDNVERSDRLEEGQVEERKSCIGRSYRMCLGESLPWKETTNKVRAML